MITIKKLKKPMFVIIVCSATMTLFMNCQGSIDGFSSGSDSNGLTTIQSKIENQNYTIQSSDQLVRSMASVTGVDYASTIINEYNARKALMTNDYSLESVTAPMLVSIANLGSQFCNELIRKEVALTTANRIFFNQIDFTKAVSTVTDAQFNQTLDILGQNFWGRNLTAEEKSILNQGKLEFINAIPTGSSTSAAQTQYLILSTCTGMLAALEFITL